MSREFLDRVAAALNARGVRGRSAQRVLAEVADHVDEARRHGDPDPVAAFGDPAVFAREVAAELATAQSRRATFAVFAALALTGVCYALVLGLVPHAGGWRDVTGGHIGAFGPVLAIALVLFPQVAFVAGCLALVGALRIRRARIVPDAELRLLRSRSAVALAAGGVTALTVALFALDSAGELAAWWAWTTLALATVSALPLAVAARTLARAGHCASTPEGGAADVFDDLGPVFRWAPVRRLELPEHPWRFALLCAAGVFVLGLVGGWYGEGDPGSGIVRGVFEALALLACFALLGRRLGLRRPES